MATAIPLPFLSRSGDGAARTPDGARISYPPWMDPLYVGRVASWNYTPLASISNTRALVIPANPLRFALWIGNFTGGAALSFAPLSRSSPGTLFQVAPGSDKVIALFTHGPIVSGEWYGSTNLLTFFSWAESVLF